MEFFSYMGQGQFRYMKFFRYPKCLTLSPMGGPQRPPPSGIRDCSKMHLYIDLKVLDFSYISKTQILEKK